MPPAERRRWGSAVTLALAALVSCVAGACSRQAAEPEPPSSSREIERRAEEPEWTTYRGAWFEIDHPADYSPRPSLASTTADGFDSVFFDSADGSVSLYVCSPQWRRDCSDILLDNETETVKDSDERVIPDGRVQRQIVAARDGSYERLVEVTELYDGTVRWVVGMRYPDAPSLERVRPLYERFTGSLRQYAD